MHLLAWHENPLNAQLFYEEFFNLFTSTNYYYYYYFYY